MAKKANKLATLQFSGAVKTSLPRFIHPELATPAATPLGDEWLHEIKFDGYRILAIIKSNKVTLLSRNDIEWTKKFISIAKLLQSFPGEKIILDGEVVVADKKGITRFQLLQNFLELNKAAKLFYYVFDILYFNGYSLLKVPLQDRKKLLSFLFKNWRKKPRNIKISKFVIGNGQAIYQKACRDGFEGLISKKLHSLYLTRRTREWIKSKCVRRQEFVIGGYTDPRRSRKFFGSLLIGFYKNNKLIYCGRVGTGFSEKTLKTTYRKMKSLEQATSAFTNAPNFKNVHWLKPKLVAEIEYLEMTADGSLRHPSFQGFREDKAAKAVVYEPFNPKLKRKP